jgi:hypothetical protein
MTIEELKNKHHNVVINPLSYKNTTPEEHTKLSIKFVISVLEDTDAQILYTLGNTFEYFEITEIITNKIQELKTYLDEKS